MKFNQADKILAGAFVLFLIACVLKMQFPSIATEFLLFIAEAALVGGIADWFATEALFRKPLGFPLHTAIIPRKRAELAEASVKFVEQEFFSKKKIVKMIHEADLISMLLPIIETPENKKFVTEKILDYANDFLNNEDVINPRELSKKFAEKIIVENHTMILETLSEKLLTMADDPETKDKITTKLQTMTQDFVGSNPMMAFFAGIATGSNILNFDEAADLLQREFRRACSEIKKFPPEFWQEIKIYPVVEKIICDLIEKNLELFKNPHLQKSVVASVYDETIDRLKNDQTFRAEIEKMLKKIAGLAALNARTQINPIISNAFEKFTDEDLIHIIRDKVETDLIWIRMNGSIVGSIVGVFIFIVLKIFS